MGKAISASTNYFQSTVVKVNSDYRLNHLDYKLVKLGVLKYNYGMKLTINDPNEIGLVLNINEISGESIK